MALSRLWYTQANALLEETATALQILRSITWGTKGFLRGQKVGTTGTSGTPPGGSQWTVVNSSDGVTTSASDLWGATYTPSALIRASAGSPHSWIVLQSSTAISALGVPLYLLISLGTPGDTQLKFVGAKTAFTGGTISADPTSVDQAAYSTFFTIGDVTSAVHRISYVTDANGNFLVFVSRSGVGIWHSLMGFMAFASPQASDLFPFCTLLGATVSGRGVLSAFDLCLATSTGLAGGAGLQMRSPTGSLSGGDSVGTGILVPQATNWLSNTTLNQGTGKHDSIAALVNYYNTTGPVGGIRGQLPDCSLANSARAVGTVEPATGATEHMLVGNVYTPNGGVAPVL